MDSFRIFSLIFFSDSDSVVVTMVAVTAAKKAGA